MAKIPKNKSDKKEPVFIVKSASHLGGLDYLHISLIILVLILVALAFALATFKQGTLLETCSGNVINATCMPNNAINASELIGVHDALGRILASYGSMNSSLSLVEYSSLINQSKIYYLTNQSMWLAIVPYKDPLYKNETFNISFILNKNLSLNSAYLSTLRPNTYTSNKVVSLDTVSIAGKYLCNYSKPLPIYYFTDPYAPGFISDINASIALAKKYGNTINVSYNFLFTQYAQSYYSSYGRVSTQQLGDYLVCASSQPKFNAFISNLSMDYNGKPISNATLYQMVEGSGLNISDFNSCISNAPSTIDSQSNLAAFYNITTVPTYIIDCKYQAVPYSINSAINYVINQTK